MIYCREDLPEGREFAIRAEGECGVCGEWSMCYVPKSKPAPTKPVQQGKCDNCQHIEPWGVILVEENKCIECGREVYPASKPKRGRPKGSKNTPKNEEFWGEGEATHYIEAARKRTRAMAAYIDSKVKPQIRPCEKTLRLCEDMWCVRHNLEGNQHYTANPKCMYYQKETGEKK